MYALAFTLLTIYTIARHFWSDLKEMKVDSRRNHMMIGAVLTIAIISNQAMTLLITGLLTIGITILLGWLEKKQGNVVFGDGDKEILSWSIPGISLVFGYNLAALFLGLLVLSFFALAILRQYKLMNPQKIPGLTFISFSYIVVLLIAWFL